MRRGSVATACVVALAIGATGSVVYLAQGGPPPGPSPVFMDSVAQRRSDFITWLGDGGFAERGFTIAVADGASGLTLRWKNVTHEDERVVATKARDLGITVDLVAAPYTAAELSRLEARAHELQAAGEFPGYRFWVFVPGDAENVAPALEFLPESAGPSASTMPVSELREKVRREIAPDVAVRITTSMPAPA